MVIDISSVTKVTVYKRSGYPVLFEIDVRQNDESHQVEEGIHGFNAAKFYRFLKNNLNLAEFTEEEYIEKEDNTFLGRLSRGTVPDKVLIMSATVILIVLVAIGYLADI